jgi:peroxin-12
LEWWYNSDFARQLSRRSNEGLELPPPTITGLPVPRAPSQNEHKEKDQPEKSAMRRDSGLAGPPISSITHLPILTVTAPARATEETPNTTSLCPICVSEIQIATPAFSSGLRVSIHDKKPLWKAVQRKKRAQRDG